MKIIIYELLGMIKDGNAPKKIKYKDKIYEYKYDAGCGIGYVNEYGFEKHWLTNCFDADDKFALNDEVEIIEDYKPFTEEIKELDKKHFHKKQRQLANKINEIIRKLKEMENEK